MNSITLYNLNRPDLEDVYWFIDEVLKYAYDSDRYIMHDWKTIIGDKYSDLYDTDDTVNLLFKGGEAKLLLHIAKLSVDNVRDARTALARRIMDMCHE